jgi:hypothetical protein
MSSPNAFVRSTLPWTWLIVKFIYFGLGGMSNPSALGLACLSDLRYLRLGWLPSLSAFGLVWLIVKSICFRLWGMSSPSVLSLTYLSNPHYLELGWLSNPSALGLACLSDTRYLKLGWLSNSSFGLGALPIPKGIWVWPAPNLACPRHSTLPSPRVVGVSTLSDPYLRHAYSFERAQSKQITRVF